MAMKVQEIDDGGSIKFKGYSPVRVENSIFAGKIPAYFLPRIPSIVFYFDTRFNFPSMLQFSS